MAILAPEHSAAAYDRRGFGDTPAADAPFVNTDDLLVVLDACATGPAVLVIVGALDLPYQRAGARALAERLPDARLVELGGMAHLPRLEAPDTLASLIKEFLAPE